MCHIHRRRGVLWRNILQSRLDPKAGFGEYLLAEGLARFREELWWALDYNNPTPTLDHSTDDASATQETNDSGQSSLSLKRLLEDRERFVAAEESAELAKKGLWALPHHEDTVGEKTAAAIGMGDGAAKSWRERSVRVVIGLKALFSRWR